MITVKRWLPALLLCTLIFVSSSLPGATVSAVRSVDISAHKFTHFVLYSLLCLCFYRATKNIFVSVLLTFLYGISDEFHQLFVPTRSGSYIDVFVDLFGGIFGGIVLWRFYANLPKKLRTWLEE